MPEATDDDYSFRLVRYNPRRGSRGKAEVEVTGEYGRCLLWMTESDVEKNLIEFGHHQGLLDAKAAYKADVEIKDS